jgi:alkaline phosphatase D
MMFIKVRLLRSASNAFFLTVALSALGCMQQAIEESDGPYQATGIKIGEVTHHGAIIWTRLTSEPERVGTEAPMPTFLYHAPGFDELQETPLGRMRTYGGRPDDWVPVVLYEEGSSITYIEGAVIGSTGETRVSYRPAGTTEWLATDWEAVDPQRDFTHQIILTGLAASTEYELRAEGRLARSDAIGSSLDGRFRTAPPPDQPARVVFTSTTGTDYEDQDTPEGGFQIHRTMMDMDVDFFVHTGDILYYDDYAKNVDLARWGWARMFSLSTNFDFHRRIPTYFMKDDHDTWQDDAWPTQESTYMGDFTFQEGIEIFKEQTPMGELTYRTFRWGQDVQIWLVEGRDYRSANSDPDGPTKTIWGAEQTAWFKETVEASDATFRILISPTPFVGPDTPNKYDSHATESFGTEARDLRAFLVENDMIVICGDRHWQYVSVHEETRLREYATGAASDVHAGTWTQGDVRPEHLYVNVIGGFLSVTAERLNDVPTLTLRNHGVDGNVLFEDILVEQ